MFPPFVPALSVVFLLRVLKRELLDRLSDAGWLLGEEALRFC